MSVTYIQQELVTLLLSAKKALSQGRDMCSQARMYQQSSEKHIETIERIHPKLLFIDNHITLQIQYLDNMKEYLISQNESRELKNKEREAKLQSLTIELTNIFNLLKECKIDKEILKTNEERGIQCEAGATLFDYISDQSIIDLQRLADDQIGEIESIHDSLVNQTKNVTNIIQELQSAKKNVPFISLNDSISTFAPEKNQLQEEASQKMADMLSSLTEHYDQVEDATRISQTGPEECAKLDITVLKADDGQLPDITENLRMGLDVVISTYDDIYDRAIIYLRTKEELTTVFNQLEQCGVVAETVYDKLMDAESEIKEREENLADFFDQLRTLANWYRRYASSYNHLLLEIDRREKAQEKRDKLRAETLQKFNAEYKDELQERKSWTVQHGHYLPQELCSFLNDSPPVLTVTIKNDKVSRIPKLSPSTVQKALAEVHSNN